MPRLNATEDLVEDPANIAPITDLIPLDWSAELDDYVLDLRGSPDGRYFAALPSTGHPKVFDRLDRKTYELPAHRGGNGSLIWHPQDSTLATLGLDSILRLHRFDGTPPRELQLPKAWTERCAWNADGSLIAVAVGRTVHVIDVATLDTHNIIEGHSATVCDILWHPVLPNQFATASDGGARLWKLGQQEPIAGIDDGVAALTLTWSPDGRWLVTGDQTPSVHLFDTNNEEPLYIRGFENKIKAFAWQAAGSPDVPWLACGGSAVITLWPCFGDEGPRGATPLQLPGHLKEVICLDIPRIGHYLASGGRDGLVLFWLPHEIERPVLLAREESEITALRWSKDGQQLAYGTSSGHFAVHTVANSSQD